MYIYTYTGLTRGDYVYDQTRCASCLIRVCMCMYICMYVY